MANVVSDVDRRGRQSEASEAQSQPSTSYSTGAAHSGYTHDGLSFGQYMLAGSLAGMVEHMAMFPVDTVKTRMQMLGRSPRQLSVLQAMAHSLKHEGAGGLYRGIGAVGLGAGPAHAVYFGVYELAKEWLGGNSPGHHVFSHATAGALATVASDAVLTPCDVVKQRLQLRRSPYKGIWDCCIRVFREEGLGAFTKSYPTTLVMNVPFTAMHFATYEAAKKGLVEVWAAEGECEEWLLTHVVAGGAAGALASAVTNPLDVVKTRLQCQGVCGAQQFHSASVVDAWSRIVREEGYVALLRGIRPRVMFHTPAAAICWSTYEAGKSWLQRWNSKQEEESGT